MQEHFGQACARNDIFETRPDPLSLTLSEAQLAPIFKESAAKIRRLYEGVARRRGDTMIELRGGQRATLYEVVLLGISQLGIVQGIGMPTLGRRMRQYVADQSVIPSRNDLKNLVTELVSRSSALKNSGETIDLIEDSLYILHPYFKIFLTWDLLPRLGGGPLTVE